MPPPPQSPLPQFPADPSQAAADYLSKLLPPSLVGNPYFEAGFGLSLVGTALAMARGGAKAAVTVAKRHFLVTLEVTSKDRSYPWVLQWLTRQAAAGRQVSALLSPSATRAAGSVHTGRYRHQRSPPCCDSGQVVFFWVVM